MRYPAFLKKGDTLGFTAPSFGCASEPYRTSFEAALNRFRGMGYKTVLTGDCYKDDGTGISTDPGTCAAELGGIYCGDYGDVSAVFSCGGGELMCETLGRMDFERLKSADPKWFTGYSDNTNFIFPLVTMCDTAAVYGPCAPAFGMKPWHRNLYDTFDLLTGRKLSVSSYGRWEREKTRSPENPLAPYNCTEKSRLVIYTPEGNSRGENIFYGMDDRSALVNFSGRLIGGCMDILTMLCGTRFDRVGEFTDKYSADGFIWFLESCDLNTISIRRAMWQFENAGWFERAKGFIIGRPLIFDEPVMGMDQYDAVLGVLERHQVPVIMDADLGHLAPSMPLIAGSVAGVRARGNKLTVNMRLE